MGKYYIDTDEDNRWHTNYYLCKIANELAEANRIELMKIKIKKSYTPKLEELEDNA